jgi:DNA polymerase bacteriophage-type
MSLKHFLFVDAETYYDDEYSLRRMSVPEYILHPKFAVQLLAVYDLTWDAPKVILPAEIPDFLAQYPASETIACAHNALFDLSILSWKYGWVPGRMADTLGMARALRSYQRYSLDAVLKEMFGYSDKGNVIGKVKGLDVQGIKNAGLWPEYCSYAMNDVRRCSHIYFKLAPEFPPEERQIMDLVLRAAVVPTLRANTIELESHLLNLRRRKAALLRDCGYDKAALMSAAQFQDALESLGVEVKMKTTPAGKQAPAFAKTDAFMQELKEYDGADDEDVNLQVQALAAARLSFKSTLEETRCERFLNIANLPWGNGASRLLPMPMRYAGAHTGRLSGEWGLNVQNLPRDKTKSKLRSAIQAPPDHMLVTADLSQIEARLVAETCHQTSLVQAFRDGEDVYASFASIVFGTEVTKKTHPNERFIGKTGILGLGYSCGATRFYQMVTTQARQYGIPLEGLFDMEIAEKTVNIYRRMFPRIPANWYLLDNLIRSTLNSPNETQQVTWGPVTIKSGTIVLPNRMTLRYKVGNNDIYGGKLLENIIQALARIILMQAALRLAKKQGLRFRLQCHDELVFAVPSDQVDEIKKTIMDELTKPPSWLPDLPLAAEIGVGSNYGETK